MSVSKDYALKTALEITKEIVHNNPNLVPSEAVASSMADFIETLYKRISEIELNNQNQVRF